MINSDEFIIMINSDVFKNLSYSKFKGGAHDEYPIYLPNKDYYCLSHQ